MVATISDVAAYANVSVATVDRVLHGRSGVSANTRQSVTDAIHSLGFGKLPAHLLERAKARLKFLFLLPKINTGFVTEMENAIYASQSYASGVDLKIEIRRVNLTAGSEIVEELESLDASEFQGVGLFAFDAPGVREAIDNLRDKGVSVVTLVSDVPSSKRQAYVGIDNMAAGRTVARLMGKFLRGVKGEIGVVAGNMNIRDHMERHSGFRQIMSQNFPNLTLLPTQEGDSLADRNRCIVLKMFSEHPDLVGIYNVGGGSTGVLAALQQVKPGFQPVVVVHEITKETREGLRDGILDAVIAQNTHHIARGAIANLIGNVLGEDTQPSLSNIGINIYVEDNLS